MPHQIADLIAEKLRTGLTHPGNPVKQQPPTLIPLPAFRPAAGTPPELSEHITATTQLIAEAIDYEIAHAGYTIIANDDLDRLRHDAAPLDEDPEGMVTVHCHCDRAKTYPLAMLAVKGGIAVVDGPNFVTNMAGRRVDCPHQKVEVR